MSVLRKKSVCNQCLVISGKGRGTLYHSVRGPLIQLMLYVSFNLHGFSTQLIMSLDSQAPKNKRKEYHCSVLV